MVTGVLEGGGSGGRPQRIHGVRKALGVGVHEKHTTHAAHSMAKAKSKQNFAALRTIFLLFTDCKFTMFRDPRPF
jgi:hypothetical protein